MDPNANIAEQRRLAAQILEDERHDPGDPADHAANLAELVLALNDWRKEGGIDPYLDSDVLNEIADRWVGAANGDSNDDEIDVRGEFAIALGGGPFIDAADARAEAVDREQIAEAGD